MITDRTLACLRTAAALTLVTPGLSVLVSVDGQPVVDARRGHDREPGAIPVCAFHRCVARAHALRGEGRQVEMVGVVGLTEPEIELRTQGLVRILPGGVVRRVSDAEDPTWIHLLALSLPAEVVAPVAIDSGVQLHADRALDVTVLVGESRLGDKAAARTVLESLEDIAVRATVESMVRFLEPSDDLAEQLLG